MEVVLHVLEVIDLNSSPEINYCDIPPRKMLGKYLEIGHDHFHLVRNSLLIFTHPFGGV
jgi:hypothetical protein